MGDTQVDIAHGELGQGGSGMFFLKGEEIRRKERREKTSLVAPQILPQTSSKSFRSLQQMAFLWLMRKCSCFAQLRQTKEDLIGE